MENNKTVNILVILSTVMLTLSVLTVGVGATENSEDIEYIEIEPQDETIIVGSDIWYSATAYDENGDEIEDVTEDTTWSIVEENHGGEWIGVNGNIYVSENAGEWTVNASYEYEGEWFYDETTLYVGIPDSIQIEPEDHTETAGESVEYTSMAYNDTYGELDEVTDDTEWYIYEEGHGGTFEDNVYETKNSGEWTVNASYEYDEEYFNTSTVLTVEPAEAVYFWIEPGSENIMAGESRGYTAMAEDDYGNEFEVTDDTTWSDDVDPKNASSWVDNEITVEKAGTWTITGEYDGLEDTATLTVAPLEADYFDFDNIGDQIADESFEITITAYDEYDNVATGYEGTANLTDTTGTINPVETGEFTEGIWSNDVTITEANDSVTITAEDGEITGESNEFHVGPTEPAYIEIEPQDSTITAGETENYSATAYDEFHNEIGDVTEDTSWSIHEDGHGGQWDQEKGEYTSKSTGEWTVVGIYRYEDDKLVNTADLNVEPDVAIEFEFEEIEDQTAGEPFNITITAYDEYDNVAEDYDGTAELEDTTGTIDDTIVFYEGVWTGEINITKAQEDVHINVTDNSIEGTSNEFTVQPAETAYIEIEPEYSTIDAGESQEYTAIAYDQYDNEIEEVTGETGWADDIDDSEWDENQVTAYTEGTWEITGEYEGFEDTATLTVEAADPDYIEILPEKSTVTAGDIEDYTATLYDQYGNEIDEVTDETNWSIDEEAGGEWVGNEYTSEKAGNWIVSGTYTEEGSYTDSSLLIVEPAEVEYVTIYPLDDQTIITGETIDFSAEAYDEYDNLITDEDTEFTWDNTTEGGLFEETELGEYEITATYEGVISAPTTVTVVEEVISYDLTIEIEGEGNVTVAWNDETHEVDDNETFEISVNTVVNLTAVPEENWTFMNWTGDYEGEEEEISITMDEDKSITANFEEEVVDIYELTIEIEGEGNVTVEWNDETHEVDDNETFEISVNTVVNLTAVPEENWTFMNWMGDYQGEEEEINITMDEDMSIKARFVDELVEMYELAIEIEGEGNVTVEWNDEVHEVDDNETFMIENNTEVILTAVPEEGWTLMNWTGDYEGEEKEIDITMDENKSITANFGVLVEYNLTIEIEGEGTTDPAEGTHTYEEGDEVTIEAIPAEGWEFVEWTGDYESEEAEITVLMDSDKNITAYFEELDEYELVIDIEGQGTTDPEVGTHIYYDGEEVAVEATPAEGWEFVEWTGDVTGTDTTIEIIMDEDKSITAVFEEIIEYELTVNIEGEGEVEIDPDQDVYEEGTEVTLTATPDDGWEFVEWTGDVTGTDTTIEITMDEDKEITANFKEEPDPAYFEVEIIGYEEEVEEGETVTVGFTVTNAGGLEGTQEIVFNIDGTEEDSVEITLDADDTYSGEFTWEAEDEGNYILEVASDDTSDSVTVTVEEEEEEEEDELIPGFTLSLLILGVLFALVINKTKKR